jgi:hypothetical protein
MVVTIQLLSNSFSIILILFLSVVRHFQIYLQIIVQTKSTIKSIIKKYAVLIKSNERDIKTIYSININSIIPIIRSNQESVTSVSNASSTDLYMSHQ